MVIKEEHQVVFHATMVRRRKKAAPNAKPAALARMAMAANRAAKVDTATAAILLRCRAEIVRRGTTTTTLGKVRVCPAAPGNSTMLPVRFVVQYAQRRRTFAAKEETAVALVVQWVGHPTRAVPNVPLVVQVRLVLGVKIAQWVMPETAWI